MQLAMRGLAVAAAVFLGGLAILLVTGSAFFGWPLWALVAGIAIALAGWQMRAGTGTAYVTAQRIDRRLGLNDAISTALHFRGDASETAEYQRREAERVAGTVRLEKAFPTSLPRAAHACWALALVGVALFFTRYGVTKRLDLTAPLVHLGFDGDASAGNGSEARRKALAEAKKRDPNAGDPAAPWMNNSLDTQVAPDNVLDSVGEPDVENPGAVKDGSAKSAASEMRNEMKGDTQGDGSTKGEAGRPGDGEEQSGEDGKQGGPQQQGGQQAKQGQNDQKNAGLMDRMRDAMTDLLAKLKPSPPQNDGKQGSQKSAGSQAGAQKQAAANATQSANNAQEGAQDPNAKGEPGAQPGQKMEAAKGRGSDNAARNDSPDAKSGIGSQDGDKDAKYADQLAAMGKISELIGKRSANVTGEVMVEVASGKQQLKTQYSSQKAVHSDAGGDVDRDEVPLAYQQYVQQYFEQIRKQPAARGARNGQAGAAQ